MANRPLRPCKHRGCSALVAAGNTYCPAHIHETPVYDSAAHARKRQARRALPTWSPQWRAIRAAQLAREPLCRMCTIEGRITEASHVDHIDGDATNNDRVNYQSLCPSCHSRKTHAEDGAFGRRRRSA